MKKKSVFMIGPLPPPIGGVSVHVSRLIEMNKEKFNIIKVNTTENRLQQGIKLLTLLIFSSQNPTEFVVHNHIFKIKFNSLIVFLCKLLKINYVQTVHSLRIDFNNISKINMILIKYILKNSYKIIAVNEVIKNTLSDIDISVSDKTFVIPAFLPYKENNAKQKKIQYLQNIQLDDFLERHDIVLCANAYKIMFYNGEDLYGIDLCIKLMKELKSNLLNKKVGLIFMLPQVGEDEYFENMKKLIKKYEIEENFVFVNQSVDLVPLFKNTDVFLRPTNTDGDALSIREALNEGVPTIASDVVQRPLGTIIFENRNLLDLYKKVVMVINNIEIEKNSARYFGELQGELIKKYDSIYD